jgi:hypothetical protein
LVDSSGGEGSGEVLEMGTVAETEEEVWLEENHCGYLGFLFGGELGDLDWTAYYYTFFWEMMLFLHE